MVESITEIRLDRKCACLDVYVHVCASVCVCMCVYRCNQRSVEIDKRHTIVKIEWKSGD